MNAAFQMIRAALGISALVACSVSFAEENCNGWSAADVDSTKGRYNIELRTCDLTYGLSAYVQIKNLSNHRIALGYRIITMDNKHRDDEIILAPSDITQAGNCQACAKRHAGFKSWEILTVKEVAEDAPGSQPGGSIPSNSSLPAFMAKPAATVKSPAKEPVKSDVVIDKPVIAKPTVVEPVIAEPVKSEVVIDKPVIAKPPAAEPAKPPLEKPAAVADVVPAAVPEVVTPPKASEATPEAKLDKKQDGFRAEDGTIIPWDKLPPEFRPRK